MNENERPLFFDLDLAALQERLRSWGEPAYRAAQIWQAVYQQFHFQPQHMTTLPLSLRSKLASSIRFTSLDPVKERSTPDGATQKILFRLDDNRDIESVLMRYDQRRTTCISTQAGCAMGCTFCATGQMGFLRNLSAGEIVEQVMFFAAMLHREADHLTNVVLMGMGEPFANYNAVMQAIDRLHNPDGFNMGERRFTISTVGLVPQILRFASEQRQINLAVSLHAATDDLRSQMMPINRKYGLEELMDACRSYVDTTHRRVTFEWALIRGVNDGLDQADAFIARVNRLRCHVNLIPLNPTPGYGAAPSEPAQVETFQRRLLDHHIPCTVRLRRGIDIQAGCGQLAIAETPS